MSETTTERRPQTGSCCEPAAHGLDHDDVATDLQTLTALSNETRYEALRIVAGAEDGRCVCEIEPALGVSQGAVSQALSRLFAAGLVTRRKEGRWRYYEATPRARRLLTELDGIREGAE
jgi:ArsR family transcriptional regulator